MSSGDIIGEYLRLISVRLLSHLPIGVARKLLMHSMQNDLSLAVRNAANDALQSYHGEGMEAARAKFSEKFPGYETMSEKTSAYFLNNLYPVGNWYAGFAVGLRTLQWMYAKGEAKEATIKCRNKRFQLDLLEGMNVFTRIMVSKKYGVDLMLDKLTENELILGVHDEETWSYVEDLINGRFFLASGEDSDEIRQMIHSHPCFIVDGVITPSCILRGRLSLITKSWGDYPDAEAVQSALDMRAIPTLNEEPLCTDKYLTRLRNYKFQARQLIQFNAIGHVKQPGVLLFVDKVELDLWDVELHFPHSVEVNACNGVPIERSCSWMEADLRGNWLRQVPNMIFPVSTKTIGIFTGGASCTSANQ